MFALKALMDGSASPIVDCRQDGSKLDPKFGRASYRFNSTIAGIDEADAIMIVGSNPRIEAPVLNARIRKRWLKGNCLIGVVGQKLDLTYPYAYLGAGPDSLAAFADHPPANRQRPMFILGAGAFARPDGAAVLSLAAKAALSLGVVKDGWNGFNMLHSAASRVGGLDLGFTPGPDGLDAPAMARPARSTSCSTSAPTRSRSRPAPSSSISGPTAIAGRIAPTSSCPAPPIPRRPAFT